MSNNKALIIFSGGQDSTTCLFKAVNDYGKDNIELITFNYGQRHKIEIEKSIFIAKDLGLKQNIVETNIFSMVKDNNALLDDKLPITTGDRYPNTFIEGRNALFILLAASYAKSLDIKDIIIGVCETDYSGYPDCREIFIKSMNNSINLAMDYNFNLITPLMYLTKEQTWELADKLDCMDYIIKYTHTCYLGVEGGCHECPSCKLREKGLQAYLSKIK